MATLIQQRRGTAAEWAAVNPILKSGEIGFETDTGVLKTGNGVDRWNVLKTPFLQVSGGTVKAPTPEQVPLTLGSHELQTADIFRVVDVNGAVLSGINSKGLYYETGSDRMAAKGDILVGVSSLFHKRFPVGASGLVLTADPSTETGFSWKPGAKAADIQIFTASGTWTKPLNAKAVTAIAFGGGQSGAATSQTYPNGFAQGGNSGSRVQAEILPSALGATETVTIGAGGFGPSVTAGTYLRNSGGDTVFGPIRAKGGNAIAGVPIPGQTPGGQGQTSADGGLPGPNEPMVPGGGGGASLGYNYNSTPGSSPVGTTNTSRSGTGLGGDGGMGVGRDNSQGSAIATDGKIPGGGGGAAYGGNFAPATAGSGARGELIVITFF